MARHVIFCMFESAWLFLLFPLHIESTSCYFIRYHCCILLLIWKVISREWIEHSKVENIKASLQDLEARNYLPLK